QKGRQKESPFPFYAGWYGTASLRYGGWGKKARWHRRRAAMPLLDHFHPPLSLERRWESFHAAWTGSLADDLNRRLPAGYFAEEQTHAGPGVEIDVATREE